jgi:hypothetical protein
MLAPSLFFIVNISVMFFSSGASAPLFAPASGSKEFQFFPDVWKTLLSFLSLFKH